MGSPPSSHRQPAALCPSHTLPFSLSVEKVTLLSKASSGAPLLLTQSEITPPLTLLLISSGFFPGTKTMCWVMNLTFPSPPPLSISQLLDETDPHRQLQGGSNSTNVLPLYTAIDLERGRNSDSGHLEISLHIVIDYADPIRVNGRTSVSCHSGLHALKT